MIRRILKDETFKRLTKHSINYGFGDVLAQVIGFLLIPLYTRYLSPGDYGIVEITATIGAFAIPLMKLGLPGSVTRQYFDYRDDKTQLHNYITTIYKLLNWAAIGVGLLLLAILFFTKELFYSNVEFWPFIVLAIVSAGLSSNNQLQQRVIQNEEQSKYSVKIKTAFTLASIGLAVLFVTYFRMGALGIVLAGLIVNFSFFVQAYFYLRKYTTGNFNRSMAKEGLRYGTGLLPHHLSAAAAPLINKTLLMNMGSLAALGTFSVSMRFFLPLEITYNMINTAFTPIYNGLRKANNNRVLRKNVRIIFAVSFAAYCLMQLVGPSVMRFMLPPSFHNAIPLLPILCIAFVGRTIYSICVAEIFYSKKTRFVSIITLSGLIVNTFICVALVKQYHEQAIAWAYAANFFFWAILGYIYKARISAHESYNREISLFLIATTGITLIAFFIQ